jgi:hypothetical protein
MTDERPAFFPFAIDHLSGRLVEPADCPHDDECDCEGISLCPACGEPIDYCQGHGPIGDPFGAAILNRHDSGAHELCHPEGCDWAHAHELILDADLCREDELWPDEPDHVRRSWCLHAAYLAGRSDGIDADELPSGEPRCDICGLPADYDAEQDLGWDTEAGVHEICRRWDDE